MLVALFIAENRVKFSIRYTLFREKCIKQLFLFSITVVYVDVASAIQQKLNNFL